MLQKIEDAYLAILRFVTILAAGVMLVAVVMLSINSIKAIAPEPIMVEVVPSVTEERLIENIMKPLDTLIESPGREAEEKIDPNMVHYEKSADIIVAFIATQSGGKDRVDKERIVNMIKRRAEQQANAFLSAAYAQNLAELIGKILANQLTIFAARSAKPDVVVATVLNVFDEEFKLQIQKTEHDHQIRQRQYLKNKEEGEKSIMMAAGGFGIFLMIVFLSIIIRIERHLRHLENKSNDSGKIQTLA